MLLYGPIVLFKNFKGTRSLVVFIIIVINKIICISVHYDFVIPYYFCMVNCVRFSHRLIKITDRTLDVAHNNPEAEAQRNYT